ncbi:hypothetical protein Lal_00009929 [Lupinus albus]|nr:hypothetical protein Lal_00009929 [Lupinus albus]
MGNQKQKWTADEEDALHRGVQKYGAGKWKNILKDPDFAPFLTSRSNIDLKDKWRNLNVSNGQGGPKDKSRTSKPKAILASASTPAASSALVPFTAPLSVVPAPQSNIVDDPSSNAEDSKNPPRYNALVFEALSAIKDANGSDANAISSFIKQNHKVPTNFRRALSTRLKRLVSQGKIEKVNWSSMILCRNINYSYSPDFNTLALEGLLDWLEDPFLVHLIEPASSLVLLGGFLILVFLAFLYCKRSKFCLPVMTVLLAHKQKFHIFKLNGVEACFLDSSLNPMQVQNGYRMKEAPSGTKSPSPSPKPKDAWPRQSPASSFVSCSETVREAAATAAYRIAEAENKAFLAAEAFKEVDRLSQMAEDNEVVLRLVTQMYEQSLRGEVVRLD